MTDNVLQPKPETERVKSFARQSLYAICVSVPGVVLAGAMIVILIASAVAGGASWIIDKMSGNTDG